MTDAMFEQSLATTVTPSAPTPMRTIEAWESDLAELSAHLVVRGPDGRILPPTFADPRPELPVLDALRVTAETRLNDETLLPWWDGEPIDLPACVLAGLPRRPRVTH